LWSGSIVEQWASFRAPLMAAAIRRFRPDESSGNLYAQVIHGTTA
jgi:hypothetical protein